MVQEDVGWWVGGLGLGELQLQHAVQLYEKHSVKLRDNCL